jgi:hypothetical protein
MKPGTGFHWRSPGISPEHWPQSDFTRKSGHVLTAHP